MDILFHGTGFARVEHAFFTIDDLSQFQLFVKLLGFFLLIYRRMVLDVFDKVSEQTEPEKQKTIENNRGKAVVTNHY